MQLRLTEEGFILRTPRQDGHLRFENIVTHGRAPNSGEQYLFPQVFHFSDVRPLAAEPHKKFAHAMVFDALVVPTRAVSVGRALTSTQYPDDRAGGSAWVENVCFLPEDYEKNWQYGEIERLLRTHRPDLAIPLDETPVPLLKQSLPSSPGDY